MLMSTQTSIAPTGFSDVYLAEPESEITDIELFFPFDVTTYRVDSEEYDRLEKGLTQRLKAINCLLADLYTEQNIIQAGVLPASTLEKFPGVFQAGLGLLPPKSLYVHLASFDLVRGRDNRFYVQRDNINTPSGSPYPGPRHPVGDLADAPVLTAPSADRIYDYDTLVRDAMEYVAQEGIPVVLSNPLCNPLFFEHAYLADRTRSELAFPEHLEFEKDMVYYRFPTGPRVKVGSVFCTACDDLVKAAGSGGVSAHAAADLLDAYRAGNVAILNAPGSSLAEAPVIFHKMADIIRYYTGEEAILNNVPSYRADDPAHLDILLGRLDQLVIKESLPDGGFRVAFGRDLSADELSAYRIKLVQRPDRYCAQEVIDFVTFDTLDAESRILPRKADFRTYVGQGHKTKIWNSGL